MIFTLDAVFVGCATGTPRFDLYSVPVSGTREPFGLTDSKPKTGSL
jgi:hypothetical protein